MKTLCSVCRSSRHERGEEGRPGASLHDTAGLSWRRELQSFWASVRPRPHQPSRQSKSPFIVISSRPQGHALRATGRHTGSHAVLRMMSVCHVCVDTYRAARSPAVNTCCYFLSFLFKAGIRLFIEAKLRHFMFKVEF